MTDMTASTGAPALRTDRAVGLWLVAIAVLIGLMVAVGGLTRLTGSGLSITDWHPLTGVIPPMTVADWQAEFAKYQGTPQYELINQALGLAGFKTLYWWEWSHRLLGRFIGVVFALPFLFFLSKGWIARRLAPRLTGIFALGGLQGLFGWWMVQSGFQPSRVAVSQYWLAAHLGTAFVLVALVLWTAFDLLDVGRSANAAFVRRYHNWAWVLVGLVFVQMLLGAFMAGTNAGHAFNTWPDYAGNWIPPGLYDLKPWWINHFENPALVHFQHRNVAYVVALLIAWLFVSMPNGGADKPVLPALFTVMILMLVQIVLGIMTVEMNVPLVLAAAHQLCALALFAGSLWLAFAVGGQRVVLAARTSGPTAS